MGEALTHYIDTFAQLRGTLAGQSHAAVDDLREQALQRAAERGLPGRREEAWRYTRLRELERRRYQPATKAQPPGADLAARCDALLAALPGHVLVLGNGLFDPMRSRIDGWAGDGVELVSIAEALERGDAELLQRLRPTAGTPAEVFEALNTAFLRDGVWLRLAAGARAPGPLHVVHVAQGPAGAEAEAGIFSPVRLLVDAAEGSALELFEWYLSAGEGPCHVNVQSRVQLGAGARMRHCKVLDEGAQTVHLAAERCALAEGAELRTLRVSLAAGLGRQDLDLAMQAPGASVELDAACLATEHDHLDHHVTLEHAAPGTRSRTAVNCVADAHGRSVFNGRIHVHPQAQQTDAALSNANLLLSDQAEVDSKPELEIYADDVRCSHGSTVGRLDPAQLFYLRSRGLSQATARSLLVRGFLAGRWDGLEEPLADWLGQRLDERLGAAAGE